MCTKNFQKTGLFRAALAFSLFLITMPLRPDILSWEYSHDPQAKGFIVYYGRASGVYSDTIDVGRTSSYEIKGLESGILYFFAVTSYDSCYNESPYSPELSHVFNSNVVSTAAGTAAPRILEVQAIGNDMLLVTFDGVLEPAAALDTSHYSVDGKAALATHLNSDGNLVLLRFQPCNGGSHTLTVTGVVNSNAAQNPAAADTSVTYTLGLTAVADSRLMEPRTFGLNPNFPNPFNPETRIRFSVPESGPATVSVHDLMGRRVRLIFEGAVETPGLQKDLVWNGTDDIGNAVASGVYLVRLQQGRRADTRRMQLIR